MTSFITTARHSLTEADFCSWVGQATAGETLEYHRGFLCIDAEVGHLSAEDSKVLRQIRRRALWASDAGLVHLVQRRNGAGDFSYLAVRRPRPTTRRNTEPEHISGGVELEEAA
jgi:hypothetical protein